MDPASRGPVWATRAACGLLALAMVLALLGRQGDPVLTRVAGLAFALLLAMPAVFLLVRADLGVAWLESLFHAANWRRPGRRLGTELPMEWSRWRNLDFGSRLGVCILTGCGLLAAVVLVLSTLGIQKPAGPRAVAAVALGYAGRPMIRGEPAARPPGRGGWL